MAAIGGTLLGGLEAMGLAADLLSSFGVLPNLMPKNDPLKTIVRVGLGQTGDFDASVGGDVPGITIWDEFGRMIGLSEGTDDDAIQQGEVRDIEIPASQGIGSPPAEYLSITSGGDDAICIAFLVITFPDGRQGTFAGDIAQACGASWHMSSMVMGISGQTPPCFWIDKNKSLGLKHQGMAVHLKDFFNNDALAREYNSNRDLMCKSGPRFRMYDELQAGDPIIVFDPPLEYDPPINGTDKDLSRIINNPGKQSDFQNGDSSIFGRAARPAIPDHMRDGTSLVTITLPTATPGSKNINRHRPQFRSLSSNSTIANGTEPARRITPQEKLIISNMTEHNAKKLCDSETSWGPDFVSLQNGLFCDMDEKKLYDLCTDAKNTCCFDIESEQLKPCDGTMNTEISVKSAVKAPKTYKKVTRWGS